jgi:hypothetical protein
MWVVGGLESKLSDHLWLSFSLLLLLWPGAIALGLFSNQKSMLCFHTIKCIAVILSIKHFLSSK